MSDHETQAAAVEDGIPPDALAGYSLLPCPFCGGPAEADTEETAEDGHFFVWCRNEQGSCPVGPMANGAKSPEAAAYNWNVRKGGER
jgi:hypothetical protein